MARERVKQLHIFLIRNHPSHSQVLGTGIFRCTLDETKKYRRRNLTDQILTSTSIPDGIVLALLIIEPLGSIICGENNPRLLRSFQTLLAQHQDPIASIFHRAAGRNSFLSSHVARGIHAIQVLTRIWRSVAQLLAFNTPLNMAMHNGDARKRELPPRTLSRPLSFALLAN
jgi:hypothetical protein